MQWSAVAVISRSRIFVPLFCHFTPFFPDLVKFCPLWWVKAMIAEAPLQSTPAASTPGQAIRCYSSWLATYLERKFRKTKKFYWATCDPVTVSVSGCATWSLGPSPDQRPGPDWLLLKPKPTASAECCHDFTFNTFNKSVFRSLVSWLTICFIKQKAGIWDNLSF